MNQDREILELAAKAAGYSRVRVTNDGVVIISGVKCSWQPLTDSGDALRLVVSLGICLEFDGNYV